MYRKMLTPTISVNLHETSRTHDQYTVGPLHSLRSKERTDASAQTSVMSWQFAKLFGTLVIAVNLQL